MGLLISDLFTNPVNTRLERCAVKDADHIVPGSVGQHVKLIQIALNQLSDVFLLIDGIYGTKTAAAVVAFKEAQTPRLRQSGQTIADKIVGIRTIKALDEQMSDLEDEEEPQTGFISLTPFGDLNHDHSLTPCNPFLDSDDFKGRISHHGTPINPRATRRMICIGGTNDVKYLEFENFVPDPSQDPGMSPDMVNNRPFTREIRSGTASDICFRSTPLDDFMKVELKRIAELGCRLTYAGNAATVAGLMPFLLSLGPMLQFEVVNKTPVKNPLDLPGLHVMVVSMLNLR